MENQLNKPLYALTIGEFIELMKSTASSLVPVIPESKPEDKEEHFTIDQIVRFLNCSKVTLHKYKKLGLPFYRIGRKVLFKKSEVLDFMRKNVRRFYGNK